MPSGTSVYRTGVSSASEADTRIEPSVISSASRTAASVASIRRSIASEPLRRVCSIANAVSERSRCWGTASSATRLRSASRIAVSDVVGGP